MKYNRLIIVLVLAVSVLVIGCSNVAKTQQGSQNGNGSGNNAAASGSQSGSQSESQGEKISVPQEQPTLVGKVKEIIGNEVTVYKVQVAANGGTQSANTQNPTGQNGNQSARPNTASNESQNAGTGQNAGAAARSNTNPNANSNASTGGGQGTGSGSRLQGFKVTEETETFLIPVGAPITTMQRGAGGVQTVGLTGIKKDELLRIWKKDDEIYFVQVMGGTGTRTGTAQGAGGNGQYGQRTGGNPGYGGFGMGGGGMGGNRRQ